MLRLRRVASIAATSLNAADGLVAQRGGAHVRRASMSVNGRCTTGGERAQQCANCLA